VVIVVGGGPAGLACALELRSRGLEVLVLERERQAGGIPRHCEHQGFGLRDLHRLQSGPRYAGRYLELARKAGAEVFEEAMVTGWTPDGGLEVTSPAGRETLRGEAIVLANGCRERPRSARLVPGSRPEGVLTTGLLQQLVQRGLTVGRRALVVGAEHVSFSAVLTLRHARVAVVGMTTELPQHQSFALARAGTALRYRVPLWTRTAVASIHGRNRVEVVELVDLDSGVTRALACDTVVFTGDWIPDNELAATLGLDLDPGTRGPEVDTGLRTARPGLFAAGNLLHGAEPADVAALSGRRAAVSVAGWLDGGGWPARRATLTCSPPLQWISPNAVAETRDQPPRGRFLLRSRVLSGRSRVEVRQGQRTLWAGHSGRLIPGRSALLPAAWLEGADPTGEPIEVRLAPG
jgi:NADPH-dependent 2,4-dienoyl-CoA reductase/sulfur reductase-like enzyme